MGAILLSAFLHLGCAHKVERALHQPSEAGRLSPADSPYLKVHARDGKLYVLTAWSIAGKDSVCRGTGELFDAGRNRIGSGPFEIPVDSVVLFETNRLRTSAESGVLTVLTVASVGLTIYCIANPKSCFGSCPTFYVTDGAEPVLQAEGFSASVAPSLEATDVDALWRARPRSRDLSVRLTNEALETHVIRRVDLLAARRPPGGRVLAGVDGRFREAPRLIPPARASGPEGDCLDRLRRFDGHERYSLADSTYLAARETLELDFAAAPDSALGLVIASRQSLLTTYLYYQALAYMGRRAGDWLAALERGDAALRLRSGGIGRALGGIEVEVLDRDGRWVRAGEDRETGPIATDVRMIPLPRVGPGPVRARLRLTKGAWRLDQVSLAVLGDVVAPARLRPVAVDRGGDRDPAALALLLDSTSVLTTFPGDRYEIHYRLPESPEALELFLESRGYYLEWMREAWLAEEDPGRAALMLWQPAEALRLLAPEYKREEPTIEESFWRSRYARP